jgi:hypothetical protein
MRRRFVAPVILVLSGALFVVIVLGRAGYAVTGARPGGLPTGIAPGWGSN